ncbi:MAG TPA: hypothetical protein VN203_21775, partial [Candidatus Acidoferrum sp.]|nr:hypothetical protein [Candidatus Acidoferrum sp.]
MMPTQFADVLLWLRGSGLRILVIIATGILVIRLLRVVADRIPRLMPAGTEPVITEREKRARTAASLLRTVGTTVVLVICAMMVL